MGKALIGLIGEPNVDREILFCNKDCILYCLLDHINSVCQNAFGNRINDELRLRMEQLLREVDPKVCIYPLMDLQKKWPLSVIVVCDVDNKQDADEILKLGGSLIRVHRSSRCIASKKQLEITTDYVLKLNPDRKSFKDRCDKLYKLAVQKSVERQEEKQFVSREDNLLCTMSESPPNPFACSAFLSTSP
jgi:hypothetical protein